MKYSLKAIFLLSTTMFIVSSLVLPVTVTSKANYAKTCLASLPLAKKENTVRIISSDSITFVKSNVLNAGSLYNLRLAAKYLNGVTLGPGDVFSFNQAVGPRTVANGFVPGVSVIDDKFVPNLGGGVCGTSTVLYQAVRKAGLPVLERYTHDVPVPYIAPGQSAAVWYGIEDFKFKNTLPEDLRINTYLKGYTLTVTLNELLKHSTKTGLQKISS